MSVTSISGNDPTQTAAIQNPADPNAPAQAQPRVGGHHHHHKHHPPSTQGATATTTTPTTSDAAAAASSAIGSLVNRTA